MAPPEGSVERWCWDFIGSTRLQAKLTPPATPDLTADGSWEPEPTERRLCMPGRPPELDVVPRSPRTPSGLHRPETRVRLVHTFLHHELQAAELFAWAVLAFPSTPREFRAGAVRLCLEELGHLHLYADYLANHGIAVGDFPVRDWFWERVTTCPDALAFVALQGLGLEGSNLDHCARFSQAFAEAGDERGAAIIKQIGHDEVSHVAFAREWFERFSGRPLDYEQWRRVLPEPLTPALMQGRPMNDSARRAAGMDDDFLQALANAGPTTRRP
ncbi:MAG: hypothetical protein CMJ98_12515 [Planctomycetes bacterium]|jgi:uncharacterized ferritin-like protein (DUF455 family)|nr:hypothetical protein [Planctomycetota bacterium]MBV20968.1 hypothetical protein [Planctomycetaceae bacterium]HJM57452.1 DUF455 family protein [Planctomycetota bacterium]